jgi:hypothetical protein
MKNKTMDKIEKLMHIKTDKNQHVSPDTVFEMCCKINEIIDILNSRLFEPTIAVHNQSQKQPEEQEDWREEWRKLSFEIGSITKHQADEIEGFISERIKEAREEGRTDVLERLEKWSTNPQQGVFYDVGCNCQERLLRFLSKLLKEEE